MDIRANSVFSSAGNVATVDISSVRKSNSVVESTVVSMSVVLSIVGIADSSRSLGSG